MNARSLISLALAGAAACSQALAQPTFSIQPGDQSVSLDATAQLKVTAQSSGGLLTYAWWFKDAALDAGLNPSVTEDALVLRNVTEAMAGTYWAVVNDDNGSATSRVATLTVDPTFTQITEGPVVSSYESAWGCNWVDYNQDGTLDLFVVNGAEASQSETNALFRGIGNGNFTRMSPGEVGDLWGASDPSWRSWVAAWGDSDNDGWSDVVVGEWPSDDVGASRLLRGSASGRFEGVGDIGELGSAGFPTWGDFDRDGWLDFYCASGWYWNGEWWPAFLYHNVGEGRFARVLDGPVATDQFQNQQAATWTDYDGDGDVDLIATDFGNRQVVLYANDGHGGLARADAGQLTRDRASFVVPSVADYDADGRLDLFFGCYNEPGRLYRNDGDGRFSLQLTFSATECGLAAWGDYDNDGHLDFYLAQGQNSIVASQLWRNNGNATFTRVQIGSPTTDRGRASGAIWGDYDNDGALDLFVPGNKAEQDRLYHNNSSSNSWLMVSLAGTASNRSAIGAKVRSRSTIAGQTHWQLREISGGNRYQDDPRAHFGLGDATKADVVRIEWPSGIVQELVNVPARQILTVTEPLQLQALGPGWIRIQCWKGQKAEVYLSDDLSAWSSLGVFTNQTGTLEVTDPDARQKPYRFYRAVSE